MIYRTRVNEFIPGANGDLDFTDPAVHRSFLRSVGEEPLQLLKHVVQEKQPWTDILTVDYTMVNSELYRVWPVEAVDEPPVDRNDWVRATYQDGRPQAGVLATNGMWWRYTTTLSNQNRARAEAILRLFLCDRRFEQPIDFDVDALDVQDGNLQTKLKTDPACVGCHVVLDPISSYLYGFYRTHPESYSESIWYYPNRETWYETFGAEPPGYFGAEGETLYDLSQSLASDSRFSTCAVEQAFEIMMGRLPGASDMASLVKHRSAFIHGGLTLQSLYRSMADDPLYQLDPAQSTEPPLRLVDPDMMRSQVQAITGFTWDYMGADMLNDDIYGVRTISGGADGLVVTQESVTHSMGSALSQQRLAEAAATYLVETGNHPLDFDASVAEGELRESLEHCVVQTVLGRPSEEGELESLADLFRKVESRQDTRTAWKVVFTAVMRHPDFLEY